EKETRPTQQPKILLLPKILLTSSPSINYPITLSQHHSSPTIRQHSLLIIPQFTINQYENIFSDEEQRQRSTPS
ncbi:unnamed protein product, partial [Didymodactylos carnosus]